MARVVPSVLLVAMSLRPNEDRLPGTVVNNSLGR